MVNRPATEEPANDGFATVAPAATAQETAPEAEAAPAPGMKFCKHCGAQISESAVFCNKCGGQQ